MPTSRSGEVGGRGSQQRPRSECDARVLKCLYCDQSKLASEFNREHVVPEAFGTFEGSFVLHEVVCTECNTYFGNTIDLQLARDSLEGLDRYTYGVKEPNPKTKFGQRALLKAQIADGGVYHGASAWWGPSEDGRALVLYPFPQLGLLIEGQRRWFPADEFPTKPELYAMGFKPGSQLDIVTCGLSLKVAREKMAAKGHELRTLDRVQDPINAESIRMDIQGSIDRTLARAVAKIAVNYLAFHAHGVAAMSQFADIRRFIRYDAQLSSRPMSIDPAPLLGWLPPGKGDPLVHVVTAAWERGQVIGRVTLFYRFHYRIVLADGGFLVRPEGFSKGHIFDPLNKQILELTKDKRRGRPLPVQE